MDVMDLGRMAIFADPTGAVFGIWQPGTFAGAELVNEPGAFAWNELETRDPAAAKAFYGRRLRLGRSRTTTWARWAPTPSGSSATTPVGGMADITGRIPDEVPAHWMVYFAVEDADAAVETDQERRRRRRTSARSTSPPAASRSSPTRAAPPSP